MAGRKAIGFTAKEAAAMAGISAETLNNGEQGFCKLGKRTEPRLLALYVEEFARRGGRIHNSLHSDSIAELRVALARAIVEHKAANFAQSLRGADGCDDDLVDGVLSAAVQDEKVTPKLRERLLGVSR
jgi:hypothetical protein